MKRSVKDIQSELNSLAAKQAYLRKLLKETIEEEMQSAIDNAAEQQKIQRIGPRMAIIHFSDLIGNPWSLQFHDWKCGGELLIKYLTEKVAPEKWYKTLKDMYDKRKEPNRVDLTYRERVWGDVYRVRKEPISAKFVEKVLEKMAE